MTTLCQSNHCIGDEHRLSIKSARLDDSYQETLHRRNTLISEETHRILRVNGLLLESENEELNEQLQKVSDQLEAAQALESQLHDQLREAEQCHAASQNSLRAKSREISGLKSEIASLNDNSLDSNKILTEKLGLSRELSSAKNELEHLRSQSESYQTLLAEKHSLDRQLSSLEVELDTTKRALERARAKDASRHEEEASAKFQLEELNQELARERKERERMEEEYRKQTAQWNTERENLQSKLDVFREEIPQARKESGGAIVENPQERLGSESRLDEDQELQRRDSRKRSLHHFDPDMTIGTPDGFNHQKKIKLASALPGDKSAFSITPFLNRTSLSMEASQLPDSSSDSDREVSSRKTGKHDSAVVSKRDARAKPKAQKPSTAKARGTKGNAAKEGKGSSSKIQIRGSSSTSALEKVPEEDGDDAESRGNDTLMNESSTGDPEKPKLKKQKFLGASREPTLFDEDEPADWPQNNRRPGPGRGLGTRGINLTATKSLHRTEGLGPPGGRTEFSPLKKNRRPL